MSNKIKGFVITLEDDVSEREAEIMQTLLLRVRSVASVDVVGVDNVSDFIVEQRVKHKLVGKLFNTINDTSEVKK